MKRNYYKKGNTYYLEDTENGLFFKVDIRDSGRPDKPAEAVSEIPDDTEEIDSFDISANITKEFDKILRDRMY